jgi:transposase
MYLISNIPTMDARQEKGLAISKDKRIKEIVNGTWAVPSASADAVYLVSTTASTCTCKDYEARKQRCKHLFAVEYVRTVETGADGVTVTTESVKYIKQTYSQGWPRYNAAQVAERDTVQSLLRGLCDGIETPAHAGRGPKPIPMSDVVFGLVMKTYSTVSGRRASSSIKACEATGLVGRAPAYNTLFTNFAKSEMTAILTRLIEQSAAPLASVESKFAVDSTGFGTSTYVSWYSAKYGKQMKSAKWLKAHVCVGTNTGIVTSVNVTEGTSSDSPELAGLVASTAERFDMDEVSADKAYLSNANLTAIEAAGGRPLIEFKSNSKQAGSPAWRRMHAMFVLREDEFTAAYRQRNNVESAFSSMKRKFGGSVRSKTFTAQTNEVLAKILCHNLAVLCHAMHEIGIAAPFGASVPA